MVDTGRQLQQLADAVPGEVPGRSTFSPRWQEGFTRLWWRFSEDGRRPALRNYYSALDLCRVPLGDWPITLGIAASDQEAVMLDADGVSEFTLEAARFQRGDVEAQLVEQHLFSELRLVARANARSEQEVQEGYVRLRRMLIEQPVLSDLDVIRLEQEFPARPAAGEPYVMALLRAGYEQRPGEGGVDLVRCANCRIPLPHARPRTACGTPGCVTKAETFHLETLGFYWVLHRAARRFVHGAGVFELRVFKEIEKLGLEPELWARLDALDVSFSVDRARTTYWGTDEKDWESPGLLARCFSWPPAPVCTRRFLVVPTHRAQAAYLQDLRTELEGRVPADLPVEVVSERKLLAEARKAVRARGGQR
ncbi:hypothetical protein ABZW03_09945 [Kitasatospora sp. NPDC004799]|uniref:restriction endonuclease-related protein n=1 Tax=Kitasatospora sp. NPDC004799 TaxID=3154460 RepID=UPI0033A19134